jgi:outer membrane immunogenic protein
MMRITSILLATVAGVGLMSSAYAADLIIEEPVVEEVGVIDLGGTWDGPYVGIFAGYAWGNYEEDGGAFEADIEGWLIGAAVGANFTVTNGIVAGVVADLAWSDIGFDNGGYAFHTDWIGSLRGRLGFDGGQFLPYLTAGLAVAGATAEGAVSDSNTHIGWTAGAGVEFAATENLSVDLLYRYSDYGAQTYNVFGGDYDAAFTTHQVSVGLNWSF